MILDIHIEQNMGTNLLMMKINPLVLRYAKLFIFLNVVLVVLLFILQDKYWVLNAQLGFISSLIITMATFFSYKRNVEKRLDNIDVESNELKEDRDKIDQIDDPYDLYSEYEEIKEEDLTPEKIKEIIKDEKSKVKTASVKNAFLTSGSFVSIYRIIGYGTLLVSFFALNNNQIFLPIPFLIGIGVVPIGVLVSRAIIK